MTTNSKAGRQARRAELKAAGDRFIAELSESDLLKVRGQVISGMCPLCGESGFKNISLHTFLMHGISSRKLRALVGFNFTQSICDPSLSEKCRNNAVDRGLNPSELGKPSKRELSDSGRLQISSTSKARVRAMGKDFHSAGGAVSGKLRKGAAPWNRSELHGRRAMYRRGCRCDECQKANSAYWRQLNGRRSISGESP